MSKKKFEYFTEETNYYVTFISDMDVVQFWLLSSAIEITNVDTAQNTGT